MSGMRRGGASGFTLIELIVILAVLSVILGMLAPFAFQLLSSERESALEEELQQLYSAIVGNPEKGIFGYAGDVGTYPKTILDLVRQPLDGSGNPLPGWKGPYVQNARIENGAWLDPLARPYEYFVVSGGDTPDQLALLSRGADGLSTNTSATPNDATSYVGPSPTDSTYPTGTNNPDNVLFPRVDGNPNALNVKIAGDVALNILNWDNNKEVNAFVPACPELYTISATSVARRAVEINTVYVQGLAFNLAQGQYQIKIAPQGLATTSWAETITVMPGATLTRTLNLTGLDSSGTPLFNLTVKNGFIDTDLEVYEFDTRLKSTDNKSTVRKGETKVFTPHGCAQIYIRKKGSGDSDDSKGKAILDQFVMPYGHFTRQLGTDAATLVVQNFHGHPHHHHGEGKVHHHDDDEFHHHHGHHRVFVYRNDILLGTVNHHQKKTFKDLRAGDKITIFDKQGTLLQTIASLGVGTTTVTLGS